MELPVHFTRFYREISPNRERRDVVERAVERIKEVVQNDGPISEVSAGPLIRQGSYAAGTLVRPLGRKPEYDIDFILPIDFTAFPDGIFTSKRTPDYILSYVQTRLRTSYGTRIEKQNKCVRIRYQDGFHIDLVPGHPIQAGAFQIPDRRSGEFINTDPQALLEWIDDLDVATGGRFRRAVTMLKRWRDENFGASRAPSGLHLTMLAGHAWHRRCRQGSREFTLLSKENSSMDALLWDLSNAMLIELSSSYQLQLPMPGIVRDDLAASWDSDDQALCASRLQTFVKRAGEALNTKRQDTAIRRWQSVFGNSFITNP